MTARSAIFQPHIFGIGLIALDILQVVGETKVDMYAGGTCGNVMTILSWLGWRATPIARMGSELAAQMIASDLAQWGVDQSALRLSPTGKAPVIVEKLRKDRNGIPYHTFSFCCPTCNRRFPGFQAVTSKAVDSILSKIKDGDVMFVDRVSKSSLVLARTAREAGLIVVFEPSRQDSSKSFHEILALSDIVKYSHERIDELEFHGANPRPLLEVQTLGRGGLRFRYNDDRRGRTRWQHLEAQPVKTLIDAAGSGDWLTAGLLYGLLKDSRGSDKFSRQEVISSLVLGQKLAAWNCSHPGARGGMYTDERKAVFEILGSLRKGPIPSPIVEESTEMLVGAQLCTTCEPVRKPAGQEGSVNPAVVTRG